jgi:hypothetical protein
MNQSTPNPNVRRGRVFPEIQRSEEKKQRIEQEGKLFINAAGQYLSS